MKALKLVGLRRVEPAEIDLPTEPGQGEVLVRLRAVGICGSDMHYYLEGMCNGKKAVYPSVLGHEPSGKIVAVGKGVDSVREGQSVALEPAITCGACQPCLAGRHNLCERVVFLGGVQAPGLLREYAVVPARNVVRLPDNMDPAFGALIEPLAVVLHTRELANIQKGNVVFIAGAGPIGLLAISVAREAGASSVVVADPLPHRLAVARELGADVAVDINSESIRDAVMDLTRGNGAHVALDAAGKPESIQAALDSLGSPGRLVLIGVSSTRNIPLDLWNAMRKEVSIYAQRRSNGNTHQALELLQTAAIDPSHLVSHRFSIERGVEAFETVAAYADGVVKAVVEI